MGNKRMLSSQIIQSDPFLEMPFSAQMLYVNLNQETDDDGFVNSPNRIMKMIGASGNDLQILIEKKFFIKFKSGVLVEKHFKINNNIRNDRYTPTVYQEEFAMLSVKKNGSYKFVGVKNGDKVIPIDNQVTTNGIPLGNQMTPQHNITEHNITECISPKIKYGKLRNVLLTKEERQELRDAYESSTKLINKVSLWLANNHRDNHYAVCLTFAENDNWAKVKTKEPVTGSESTMTAEDYEYGKQKVKEVMRNCLGGR
jgi:hypothetical protein